MKIARRKPADVMEMILDVPPSVNHCYVNTRGGGKKLNKVALDWIDQAQQIARRQAKKHNWETTIKEKVVTEIYTYFPDNRVRDAHNGSKVLMDALEGIVFDNDRWALPRYMDVAVDRENPRVELKIYKLEGK